MYKLLTTVGLAGLAVLGLGLLSATPAFAQSLSYNTLSQKHPGQNNGSGGEIGKEPTSALTIDYISTPTVSRDNLHLHRGGLRINQDAEREGR